MSNELALFNKLPAYLVQEDNNSSSDLITSEGSIGPVISLENKRFTLKNGSDVIHKGELGQPLNIVIVLAKPKKGTAKTYYEGTYNPSEHTPPTCSSADGITPDEFIERPCAQSCAICPKNVFGSSMTGEGKACKDKKYLYCVAPSDLKGTQYRLTVPPTSLKNLSQYGILLRSKNVPIEAIITEISFDDDEAYAKLKFKPVGYLSKDDYETVKLLASNTISTEETVEPKAEPVAVKAAVKVKKEIKKAAPTPVEEVSTTEPASDIDDILAKWS